MRKVICIVLIAALAFQCFSKLGLMAYYQLNKSYITELFCINKDKPQMHCDGQCHLAKQLKAEDEQENKSPAAPSAKSNNEVTVFILAKSLKTSYTATNHQETDFHYINKAYTAPCGSVFHPPCAA